MMVLIFQNWRLRLADQLLSGYVLGFGLILETELYW